MIVISPLLGISSLSHCQVIRPLSSTVKPTVTLISYFETLVSKNILCIENLKSLRQHDVLINPLSQEEAFSSAEVFAHRKQINQLIEKGGSDLFDVKEIQKWAAKAIVALEEHYSIREEVYEKTERIRGQMSFVPVPAGIYVSAVDHEQFEIPDGLEIQDTEVTQWEWVERMHDNRSPQKGGGSEVLMLGNQKVKLRADCPVEIVNDDQIQKYLKKLNDEDEEYNYNLPSIREYEAILQATMGKDWLDKGAQVTRCTNHSCAVTAPDYLTIGHKRLWGLTGNVWECTRDKIVMSNEEKAHLAFGGSYNTRITEMTNMNAMIRPVLSAFLPNLGVGFRLIRCKKNRRLLETIYEHTAFVWDEHATKIDDHWMWDDTWNQLLHRDNALRWMFENEKKYSQEVQNTLSHMKSYEDDGDLLEYCQIFNRNYGSIADLSPFARLPELRQLFLESNQISDISPLSSHTKLMALHVGYNKIEDIASLKYLVNLKSLSLNNNQITDISSLAHLTNLDHLSLFGNKIVDILPLAKLMHLEGALDLDGNYIIQIPSLANLTRLTELLASSNKITDVSGLSDLVNLKRLTLKNNQITDISALANLVNLYDLELHNNNIQDISPVAQLSKVRNLFLDDNAISDIPSLARLTELKTLLLNGNRLSDLSSLSQLVSLTELGLDGNLITDMRPLGQLINLTYLKVGHNTISDITPLVGLVNLTSLELQNNNITDITPLVHLTSLKNLNLCNNPIKDLTRTIKRLKSLIQLDIDEEQAKTLKREKIDSRVMINTYKRVK